MSDFLFQDLDCANQAALTAKLTAFKQAGASKMQLVFDFDRTLTISKPGVMGDITTWRILAQYLPPAAQKEYLRLFEHYRPFELRGEMTDVQATEWWSAVLALYVQYKINLRTVEREFLSKASIRPYAKELFDLCTQHAIPTVILSAGVKDVIEIWAQTYGVHPTVIHSTALQLDPDGVVLGWDPASLVHLLNKHELANAHDEISALRRERPMIMLVGDSLPDANMAEGADTIVRLFIDDPRPDERSQASHIRQQALGLFDAVIDNGSLKPMYELARQIVG